MTTSSWDRSRSVASVASVLTVIAVVAGAVILALGVGVPDTWWPHTGQAFAADTHTTHQNPCARIIGPAKAYCERGVTTTAATKRDVACGVWRLGTASAGVAALVVWRRRSTAGQRRH
ncbi:hypothetical protein [Streptomyces sp. NPDC058731]|uniref:hypothetical protein n=1 Tax=Streptomyces sp. NPDC058731 TaxID=3346613 RepID=UPI0036C3ADA7